jgi:hypothetical protein
LKAGQFDIEKSEQTPRPKARHEIETYIKDAELDDSPVQVLPDFSDLCSAQFPNKEIKEFYSVRIMYQKRTFLIQM